MNAARLLPFTLLLALAACTTTTEKDGVPAGRPNAMMQADVQRRIDELRYLHDQELLDTMLHLASLGDAAVPQIRAGSRTDDWFTRASLAWVMGATGDRRYIPDLRRLVADPVKGVRFEASAALVELGDNAGFPTLVEGLSDQDLKTRYKCFEALRRATGQDFGYQHDAAPDARRAAITRWNDWLETLKASAL